MNRLIALMILLMLNGCASVPPSPDPVLLHPMNVELDLAGQAGREPNRLNVSVRVFESAQNVASSLYVAAEQVRSVERRFIPYVLKTTLDRSGYWGAVRVMPRFDPNAEVQIEGRILESSGLELKLHIRVTDAAGQIWIDRTYHDAGEDLDYASDPTYTQDPFQDLYNRVANDMAEIVSAQSATDRQNIMDLAMVRYGQTLAPRAFDRYVTRSEQGFTLGALPARSDPLFAGVERIRESEYLFADSVDAHYEGLYRSIGPTYAWWRYYGYELIMGNERLESIDATRGATRGSWYSMERIYKTFKEAKMNQDALRELTESFDRETASTTAEIAGRVVRLNGSLEAQYETWRRILSEMYRAELGLD